jgi:hypothetical protein
VGVATTFRVLGATLLRPAVEAMKKTSGRRRIRKMQTAIISQDEKRLR